MRYSKNFRHQHANGMSTWHFEWCTKYRYKVFSSENNKNFCTIALNGAAKKTQVQLLELEVQPEHVHMIAELPLTKTPIDAVRDLKSLSARILFALIPKLKWRYPQRKLWSRGKFVMSVATSLLKKQKNMCRTKGLITLKS